MPAELLETAARIFRAEALDGYRDRVVIGGLAGFVERLHTSLDSEGVTRVADLLREYARLEPSGRAERLKEAMSLLAITPRPLGEVARSAGEGCERSGALIADSQPSP